MSHRPHDRHIVPVDLDLRHWQDDQNAFDDAEQIKKCHELLDTVNVPRAETQSLFGRLSEYIELQRASTE